MALNSCSSNNILIHGNVQHFDKATLQSIRHKVSQYSTAWVRRVYFSSAPDANQIPLKNNVKTPRSLLMVEINNLPATSTQMLLSELKHLLGQEFKADLFLEGAKITKRGAFYKANPFGNFAIENLNLENSLPAESPQIPQNPAETSISNQTNSMTSKMRKETEQPTFEAQRANLEKMKNTLSPANFKFQPRQIKREHRLTQIFRKRLFAFEEKFDHRFENLKFTKRAIWSRGKRGNSYNGSCYAAADN